MNQVEQACGEEGGGVSNCPDCPQQMANALCALQGPGLINEDSLEISIVMVTERTDQSTRAVCYTTTGPSAELPHPTARPHSAPIVAKGREAHILPQVLHQHQPTPLLSLLTRPNREASPYKTTLRCVRKQQPRCAARNPWVPDLERFEKI